MSNCAIIDVSAIPLALRNLTDAVVHYLVLALITIVWLFSAESFFIVDSWESSPILSPTHISLSGKETSVWSHFLRYSIQFWQLVYLLHLSKVTRINSISTSVTLELSKLLSSA